MENNVTLKEQVLSADSVLKVTALVYFKDALAKQEYETCPELLGSARRFGAQQSEIDEVIASVLRGKPGGRNGAKRSKNRLE